MWDESSKQRIVAICLQKIEEQIALYEMEMLAAQESANHEEKSSAGDKYETGRAMSQNARNMYAQKLEEKRQEKSKLNVQTIKLFVCKAQGTHADLICLSGPALGAVKVDNQVIMAVSPASPLGSFLKSQKETNAFVWNQKPFILDKIL